MKTANAKRQAALRARRKAAGLVRHTVWATPAQWGRVREVLYEHGMGWVLDAKQVCEFSERSK